MFWKIEALTIKGSDFSQTFEGSLEEVKLQLAHYDLEVISINPDYKACINSLF